MATASSPIGRESPAIPRAGHEVTLAPEARFRAMVDAHHSFIWRSLRGLGVPCDSADDAAQHVFWVAAQKLEAISDGSERAFLFRTAVGVAANTRRAHARRREVHDEVLLDAQIDHAPDPEKQMEMQEARAMLDTVLAAMPDDLRTVFILFVLEGTSAPELAHLLEIPEGTVASRVRRAREVFQEITKRIQARASAPKGTS